MVEILKRFIDTKIVDLFYSIKNEKQLTENYLSLFVLQIANYVLPLSTLPYLSRVLGPEKYGMILYAFVVNQYFLILTDYGFNLTGTRQIATFSSDRVKLNKIFCEIMASKLLLVLTGFIILFLLTQIINNFQNSKQVLFITYGITVGTALNPIFFFQGMEDMKTITRINLISKLIFTIMIFIYVNSAADLMFVALFNSSGYLVSGIYSLYFCIRKYHLSIQLVACTEIKSQLKGGFAVFLSNISISLYTITNTLVLGIVTNNIIMGYYLGAEKIIQGIKFIFNPIFQAIYPFLTKKVVRFPIQVKNFISQIGFILAIINTVLVTCIFLFSKDIILLFLGPKYYPAVNLLRIFSILIFTTPLAYLIFNVGFLIFKLDKYHSLNYVSSAIANGILIIMFLFVFDFSAFGAALANVLTQIFSMVYGLIILRKKVYARNLYIT